MYLKFIRYSLPLLVGLQGIFLTSHGQIINYSNLHENLYHLNPAVITNVERLNFQGFYRNQWPGNSDFITYNAALFLTSARYKSSMGLHIFRDEQGGGIIRQNQAHLVYGYKTPLSRSTTLAAGIDASFTQVDLNTGNLVFENGQEPTISDNENNVSIDFSVGAELTINHGHRIGASVNNINAFTIAGEQLYRSSLSILYTGNYPLQRNYGHRGIFLEPMFGTTVNPNFTVLQYGGRIRYDNIYGGLYTRQSIKFQFDALILLLGTRFNNIALFYTYDINLSGVGSNFSNLAAHEVTFSYDLEYKRKSKKKGAIKCPDI